MKRRMMMVLMVFCFISAVPAFAADPATKADLDGAVEKVLTAVAEVKGDTVEIKNILGKVFVGTVPNGGTLTKLCNENGWSLVVLMGHNDIKDADTVKAGAEFKYPANQAEFDAALKKGQALHREWLNNKPVDFKVRHINAESLKLQRLEADFVHVKEQLLIKEANIDQLKIRLAEITEKLKVKQAEIDQLNINQLNVKQANIDQLHIKQLEIDNLKDLLAQAQARCADLEAHPKVVIQSVDGSTYVAPSDMRLLTKGSKDCDERPFSGDVTKAALKASGGKSVAIIELHDRGGKKSPRFKAKRLYVDGATGKAIPMEWSVNGSCVRAYDDDQIGQPLLASLLAGDETLGAVNFTELNLQAEGKSHGNHLTTAVFVVKKK